MTVLVLAAETDRTVDGVVTELNELRVPVMRVDTSWFPQNMSIAAEFHGGCRGGVLRTTHHEVELGNVRSVWVRTPSTYEFPDTMSAAERDYAPFLAQLHLPPGVFRSMWCRDDGVTITELRAPDGSWCEITREPGPDGCHAVREAGPTALCAHIETAWEQWDDLGAPAWHEFGLTATPTQHTVWFGAPNGPNWPLPIPDDNGGRA